MTGGVAIPRLTDHMDGFLAYLAVERGASPHTIAAYRRDLSDYTAVLVRAGDPSADEVEREHLTGYVNSLRERGLAPSTIERKVASVKSFHKFLVREGITDNHPTARLPLPKVPQHLPDVISIEQVEKLFSQPFPPGPSGLRDVAMLEMLYGCGIRVSELTGLDLDDVALDAGFIRVFGKGGKERDVPVAGEASRALGEYVAHGRPYLRPKRATARVDSSALFVSARGTRLSRQWVHALVRRYGGRVGLDLHPHTLRHSFATHMLAGGADLRSLQEMLGHADIATTQVYTHVDRQHLREEYLSTHPRARLR